MSNVVYLNENICIHEALRDIADNIERGDISVHSLTMCTTGVGAGVDVYHLGSTTEAEAGVKAVFDMTIGLAKITSMIMRAENLE
jgi:hypothetical protein